MMLINLQLFGGRGSSSSSSSRTHGVSFTDSAGKHTWFFETKGKNHFFSRGAGATPEPTPNNMSPRQMVQRLKKNAQNVKTISKSEKARALKDYKKDRKEVDKFLNQAYVSDRTFVKGSRSDRITNRANKRK